ncbi:MAG: effector-associated domain EAD1-containing protein [Pseudomonadota bacterium]|nr:effector-associated domain EAD1-containing protein [Pseudomonadota bacterium]
MSNPVLSAGDPRRDQPPARLLERLLAELIDDREEAKRLALTAGLNRANLDMSGASARFWANIFDRASQEGAFDVLLTTLDAECWHRTVKTAIANVRGTGGTAWAALPPRPALNVLHQPLVREEGGWRLLDPWVFRVGGEDGEGIDLAVPDAPVDGAGLYAWLDRASVKAELSPSEVVVVLVACPQREGLEMDWSEPEFQGVFLLHYYQALCWWPIREEVRVPGRKGAETIDAWGGAGGVRICDDARRAPAMLAQAGRAVSLVVCASSACSMVHPSDLVSYHRAHPLTLLLVSGETVAVGRDLFGSDTSLPLPTFFDRLKDLVDIRYHVVWTDPRFGAPVRAKPLRRAS